MAVAAREVNRVSSTEPHDWDLVEELAFQCLELRASAPDAAATKIAALLAPHPQLAGAVHKVLQQIDSTASSPTDTGAPPTVPERLGPYRLGPCLGQGGMGAVYEASDPTLGRSVAVKIVRPELLLFGQARERFRREAEAVARLSHPGIVPVYQVGEDQGVPWFAMELVAGRSLADVLRTLHGRDPASLTAADLQRAVTGGAAATGSSAFTGSWEHLCVRIVLELAQALAHAHDRGVLHRDVKPSNVVLDHGGHPRLLDFGLARADGSAELTRTGAAIGSLPYMPPEQLRGSADADARGDVYALGVLLYELLSLRSPFLGSNEAATRRAVETGDAMPVRRWHRGLRWETTVVTAVAMDRDPARRYQGMQEFAGDLQRVLDRRPILARPPGALRRLRQHAERHPVRATLLAIGLVAVVVGPLLYTLALQHERDLARTAQHDAERLRGLDRRRSYRAGVQAAQLALHMGQATKAREQLERCPEELRAFEWHHLARQLDDSSAAFPVSDGFVRRVAFTDAGLFTASADGHTRLWSLPDGRHLATFGPDNDAAALTMAASADGTCVLTGHLDHAARLWHGTEGTLRALFPFDELYDGAPPARHQRSVFAVAMDARAKTAYAASAGGVVAVIDLDSATVRRSFRLPVQRGGPFALAVSPDGGLLAASCDLGIQLLTPDGAVQRTLRGHQGFVFSLRFSADGSQLLSGSQDRTARLWSVADGAPGTMLLGHDGEVHEATFDGPDTVWTASNDGSLRQWNAANGRELQRRLGHRGAVYGVRIAADPRRMASAGWDGTARLWDPDTGAARRRIRAAVPTRRTLLLHGDGAFCSIVNEEQDVLTIALPSGRTAPPLVEGAARALAVHGGTIARARGQEVVRLPGGEVLAGTNGPVEHLAFLDDGTLVAAEAGGDLVVWAPGADDGQRRTAHDKDVRALLPCAGGFVTASEDGRVLRWRLDGTFEVLAADSPWQAAALSPDGRTLYLCGFRRVVAVAMATATPRWDRAFETQMRGVSVTSAGRRVLVAGSDQMLHVLDSEDGEPIVGLPADNLVARVVATDAIAVTSTVYSEIDLWLGDSPR